MASVAEINKLHRGFCSDLRAADLLDAHIIIRKHSGASWQRKGFRGTVGFELWVPSAPEYGANERGRREPVAALPSAGGKHGELVAATAASTVWVSWFEAWSRPDRQGFSLSGAKWTVFLGVAGDDAKAQILRAEWNPSLADRGACGTGQPHWHVDRSVLTRREPRCTELEEIEGRPRDEWLSLKRVHLAMGGWRNQPPAPHPWHMGLGDDLRLLREWAVETLRYIKRESRFLRIHAGPASGPTA